MCKIWWRDNKLFYFNTDWNVFIVMRHTRILFLKAKLDIDGKMFGEGDGFPDSAETPRIDFYAMMYYDYRWKNSFQRCLSFSDCFGDYSSSWSTTHRSGIRNFTSTERRLKTVTIMANLWSLVPNKTWDKLEVSDQKRPTNYKRWGNRQFESFIGKLT